MGDELRKPIKWDRPCYRCGSHYCDLSCPDLAKNANAVPQDQDAKPMVIGYFMRTAENGDSHYFSIPDTLPEGKYEIVLRAAMKEKT